MNTEDDTSAIRIDEESPAIFIRVEGDEFVWSVASEELDAFHDLVPRVAVVYEDEAIPLLEALALFVKWSQGRQIDPEVRRRAWERR